MKSLRIVFLLFFALAFAKTIAAQDTTTVRRGYFVPVMVIDGDTVLHVQLQTITIYPYREFKSNREKKKYNKLVNYVKKVYPYSQIIRRKLDEMGEALDTMKNERQRKKFIKQKETELRSEFEGQLRKLTFTQGRILLKLVDRETGQTTYTWVEDLKGSFSAVFWQSVARLFGSNLKAEYDPEGDDALIEEIVTMIENGQL